MDNNLSSSSYQFLLIMCHSKSNVHLFHKHNPGKVTSNIHCLQKCGVSQIVVKICLQNFLICTCARVAYMCGEKNGRLYLQFVIVISAEVISQLLQQLGSKLDSPGSNPVREKRFSVLRNVLDQLWSLHGLLFCGY